MESFYLEANGTARSKWGKGEVKGKAFRVHGSSCMRAAVPQPFAGLCWSSVPSTAPRPRWSLNNKIPPSDAVVSGLQPKRGATGGVVGFPAQCSSNDQTRLRGQRFPEFGCRAATLKVWYFLPSSPDFLSVQSFSSLSPPRSLAPREPKRCRALSQESLAAAAVEQEKTAYIRRNMAQKLDSKHCVL